MAMATCKRLGLIKLIEARIEIKFDKKNV